VNDQGDGYSGLFYVMLIVGIIGVLGFVLVAAGAGS
jgi:hypothetical protein